MVRLLAIPGRAVTSAPLASTYALVLLVTTLVLRNVSATTAEQLLNASSTDVAHLSRDPVTVLILSALWLPGEPWLDGALVLLLVAAPLERRIGSARTGLVFLSGHVLATLLTELPIAAGIAVGWLTPDDGLRIDVGASYGLMAVLVAFIGGLTPVRGLLTLAVAGPLVVGIPTELDLTTYGHLLAAVTGACWWPTLHHRISWRTVRDRLSSPQTITSTTVREQE